MIMARDIQPLMLNDLPELSRFLTAGFQASPAADFAAPEVLRWKYLEPPRAVTEKEDSDAANNEEDFVANTETDMNGAVSYVVRDDAGRIVGHLGLCRTVFEGQAVTASCGQVATVHIIDWLSSPDHRSVGMSLMRRAHHGVVTQFGLGVSHTALVVGERAGYELRSLVPVYSTVLRAGYWLRTGNFGPVERGLRLAWHTMSWPAPDLLLLGRRSFPSKFPLLVPRSVPLSRKPKPTLSLRDAMQHGLIRSCAFLVRQCRAGTCSMRRGGCEGLQCLTSFLKIRDGLEPARSSTACSTTSTRSIGRQRCSPSLKSSSDKGRT